MIDVIGIIFLASLGLSLLGFIISVFFSKSNIKEFWKELVISTIILIPIYMFMFILPTILIMGSSNMGLSNDYLFLVVIVSMLVIIIPFMLYSYIITPLIYLFFRKKSIDKGYTQAMNAQGCPGKVVIVNNSSIACTMGITSKSQIIMIGQKLIDRLTKDELYGILYHEVGHIKGKHLSKMLIVDIIGFLILMIGIRYANLWSDSNPYIVVPVAALLGGLLPFRRTFMRRYEKEADCYASHLVGKDVYISALMKLNGLVEGRMNNYDIEHPKLCERINNIKNVI